MEYAYQEIYRGWNLLTASHGFRGGTVTGVTVGGLCRQDGFAELADAGGDAGEFIPAFWMDFNVWLGESDGVPAFDVDAVLMQAGGDGIVELNKQGLFCLRGVGCLTVVCPVGEPVNQCIEDVVFQEKCAVFAEFVEHGDDALKGFLAV